MTGEMCREEVTAEAYPLHFAIAKEFGGTVEPFDQYQGPYVRIGMHKLWLTTDDGATVRIYNDATRRESRSFNPRSKAAPEWAIEAAQSVMEPTKKTQFEVTVRRVVREELTLTVWAENANEAREEADLEAPNRDGWKAYDCSYSTDADEVKEVLQ